MLTRSRMDANPMPLFVMTSQAIAKMHAEQELYNQVGQGLYPLPVPSKALPRMLKELGTSMGYAGC